MHDSFVMVPLERISLHYINDTDPSSFSDSKPSQTNQVKRIGGKDKCVKHYRVGTKLQKERQKTRAKARLLSVRLNLSSGSILRSSRESAMKNERKSKYRFTVRNLDPKRNFQVQRDTMKYTRNNNQTSHLRHLERSDKKLPIITGRKRRWEDTDMNSANF